MRKMCILKSIKIDGKIEKKQIYEDICCLYESKILLFFHFMWFQVDLYILHTLNHISS